MGVPIPVAADLPKASRLAGAKLTILDNFYSIAIETLEQGKEKEKT
jgi:hypothetical protein